MRASLLNLFVAISSLTIANLYGANILDLPKDQKLSEVPRGTEIRINLPQDILDKDLALVGGSLYADELYFENGKLESRPHKYSKGVAIYQKQPAANGVLCSLRYSQYTSPRIIQKEPELVMIVDDSSRVIPRRNITNAIYSVILDTEMTQTTSLHFSVAILCQSGGGTNNFSSLTVANLLKSFGKHLVRK